MMSSSFLCAYWPSVCLPRRNIYSSLLPFFELGCFAFLLLSCGSSLCGLDIHLFSRYMICKSLPFCTKVLNLDETQFICFFFSSVACTFGVLGVRAALISSDKWNCFRQERYYTLK